MTDFETLEEIADLFATEPGYSTTLGERQEYAIRRSQFPRKTAKFPDFQSALEFFQLPDPYFKSQPYSRGYSWFVDYEELDI